MSAAPLSPAAALAWLHSLSAGLRASAVLGADGAVLAGDPDLGRRAAIMFDTVSPAAGPGGGETVLEARDGAVFAVRSGRHTVAADVGGRPLERLVRADLRAALRALDGA